MEYNLDNNYTFWYHSIKNTKWDKNSYIKIYDIKNLFDYKLLNQILKKKHLQNGMFFIMKNNIFPNWEDPDNRNGGCLSFKIQSTNIINEWNNLLLKCITGNIVSSEFLDEINGISISPKKEFNIIKIWFKNHGFKYDDIFNSEANSNITLDKSLYKKHDI